MRYRVPCSTHNQTFINQLALINGPTDRKPTALYLRMTSRIHVRMLCTRLYSYTYICTYVYVYYIVWRVYRKKKLEEEKERFENEEKNKSGEIS